MEHNYLKKLALLHSQGKIPREVGINHLHILHDDWCNFNKGKCCNCDPDIIPEDDKSYIQRSKAKEN